VKPIDEEMMQPLDQSMIESKQMVAQAKTYFQMNLE
jgi:hypothetical protein